MGRTWVVVVLATVGLVACGGDDGGGATATTAEPSPTTAAPAPTTTADLGPDADRIEARISVIGGPDAMAATEDALWVKRDDGTAVRIDPATNEVVAEVQLEEESDGHLCQGIGVHEGAPWSCDHGSLAQIDPATDAVALRVPVERPSDVISVPSAFGAVWSVSGDGSTLVGVTGSEVSTEIDLGLRCTEIAPAGDGLWLSCLTEDAAVLVDVDQGAVVRRVDGLEGAKALATSDAHAWVAHDGGIAQLDIATGALLGTVDLNLGVGGGLHATADGLWVRTPGLLQLVDPASLEVVDEVVIPEASGGSVIEAFGSIWTTAYDDAALFRINCGPAACR